MTAEEHSKPVRLAQSVLHAAVDKDWRRAERYLGRLNAECAADGLGLALVAWCDALAEHANDGMPEFGRVNILDIDQDTGARLTELTPQQRWSSAVVERARQRPGPRATSRPSGRFSTS